MCVCVRACVRASVRECVCVERENGSTKVQRIPCKFATAKLNDTSIQCEQFATGRCELHGQSNFNDTDDPLGRKLTPGPTNSRSPAACLCTLPSRWPPLRAVNSRLRKTGLYLTSAFAQLICENKAPSLHCLLAKRHGYIPQ